MDLVRKTADAVRELGRIRHDPASRCIAAALDGPAVVDYRLIAYVSIEPSWGEGDWTHYSRIHTPGPSDQG